MTWSDIGAIATAAGVFLGAWQLRRAAMQARTDFEDDLAREYRELAKCIPVEVHLGADLADEEYERAFPCLYQYIDLTNEQIFLRMNGRISQATWNNWRDGIEANMGRPAFAKAWLRIKSGANQGFNELKCLERSGYAADPRRCVPFLKRLWPV